MIKLLCFFEVLILLFTLSCIKNENIEILQINSTLNENSHVYEEIPQSIQIDEIKENNSLNTTIDGYYVNDDFDIWKITTINENTAIMEIYSDKSLAVRRWNSREMSITSYLDGYLLRGFITRGQEFYAFIYKNNDALCLETDYISIGEEINIIRRENYKKTNFVFDQITQYRISDFVSLATGMRYSGTNELLLINPLYPNIFIYKITVDNTFKIINIEAGEIIYENNMF